MPITSYTGVWLSTDIKGGNILVDTGGICKIADFGCSKYMSDLQKKYSLKGSPYWMAPEVILQEKYERFADIWSLGCTIIEMATGRPPYAEENQPISAMLRVAHSTEPPKFPKHLSEEGKNFLSYCFQINPRKRLNVRKLLEHPFVSNLRPTKYDSLR
jgi:mitogen-activated protein kinase kinase kinase 3